MNRYSILRYGATKRLRKGVTLRCFITFSCNLNCWYCTNRAANGEMPSCPILTFEEWKERIERFPVKIREVIITGGEPTLFPRLFNPLVNWLLHEKKYHVAVWTNLAKIESAFIEPSHRLRFGATYHHSDKLEQFKEHLRSYRKHHRVDVSEIVEQKSQNSQVKGFLRCYQCRGRNLFKDEPDRFELSDGVCNCWNFMFSPRGRLFINTMEMLKYYAS